MRLMLLILVIILLVGALLADRVRRVVFFDCFRLKADMAAGLL